MPGIRLMPNTLNRRARGSSSDPPLAREGNEGLDEGLDGSDGLDEGLDEGLEGNKGLEGEKALEGSDSEAQCPSCTPTSTRRRRTRSAKIQGLVTIIPPHGHIRVDRDTTVRCDNAVARSTSRPHPRPHGDRARFGERTLHASSSVVVISVSVSRPLPRRPQRVCTPSVVGCVHMMKNEMSPCHWPVVHR